MSLAQMKESKDSFATLKDGNFKDEQPFHLSPAPSKILKCRFMMTRQIIAMHSLWCGWPGKVATIATTILIVFPVFILQLGDLVGKAACENNPK